MAGNCNSGRLKGDVYQSPKVFFGVGCGLPTVIGSAGRQMVACMSLSVGDKPVKTFQTDRICLKCKGKLSIYNPNDLCSLCDNHKLS